MPGVWGVLQPRATNHASRVLPLSLLESTLAELNQNKRLYLPLESTLMKKPGEGWDPPSSFPTPNLRTCQRCSSYALFIGRWKSPVTSYPLSEVEVFE